MTLGTDLIYARVASRVYGLQLLNPKSSKICQCYIWHFTNSLRQYSVVSLHNYALKLAYSDSVPLMYLCFVISTQVVYNCMYQT